MATAGAVGLWSCAAGLWSCALVACTSWVLASTGAAAESGVRLLPLMAPVDELAPPPRASDVEVLFDGQPQTVIRIAHAGNADSAEEAAAPWHVVIYFDAPLSSLKGLRVAARSLAGQAESLARLGRVEIVLADPLPRLHLEASRDPRALSEALGEVTDEILTAGELQWLRRRFRSGVTDSEDHAFVLPSLESEVELVVRQRVGLLSQLGRAQGMRPRLLILVQDGHDLNPRPFYADQAGSSFLQNPRSELPHSVMAKAVACEGWTVLALALGQRPELVEDPLAPLFELVHAAGGEVVTRPRTLESALDRVSSWPVAAIELSGPPDGRPRPLKARLRRSGAALETAKWASVARPEAVHAALATAPSGADRTAATSSVIELLRPEGLALTGSVRFRTVCTRKRIDRVAFLLDGETIASDGRAPFSAVIDLGSTVRPRTVSAVAYSKSGRVLGEDTLELNTALELPRVEISEMDFEHSQDLLRVTAAASAPSGVEPERIDFFLNRDLVATSSDAPYDAQMSVEGLGSRDFVRVVAHYPSGVSVETARLVFGNAPADELEVNLVELVAMVTPKRRQARVELERGDFVIRQRGRSLPIDQFSRWEDLPLTLGLVLDTSQSMKAMIDDARRAGEQFFQQALRAGDQGFVVEFDHLPHLSRRPTADSEHLMHSLERLEASGYTALYDAIVFSLLQFEGSSGRRALVVVTDGEDSASRLQPRDCVRQARMLGVPVYFIVFSAPPEPHRERFHMRNQTVASRTGGQVYYISDLDDLTRIYEQIGTELRRQYLLSFSANRSLTPGELEEIEVEVLRKGMSVRTLLACQQRGG